MKMFSRILLTSLLVLVILYIVIPMALSNYDSNSRHRLLMLISRELPQQASIREMDDFMRNWTVSYSLEQNYAFQFGGFLRQTVADRILFDRKVQIILHVNRKTKRFQRADVRIYYTFL